MAHDEEELGEGHSVASWTTVIIMLVAFAAGTIFFWFDIPEGVWASVGLLVLGAIIGKVLQRAGYGVYGTRSLAAAAAKAHQ